MLSTQSLKIFRLLTGVESGKVLKVLVLFLRNVQKSDWFSGSQTDVSRAARAVVACPAHHRGTTIRIARTRGITAATTVGLVPARVLQVIVRPAAETAGCAVHAAKGRSAAVD